MFTRNLEVKVAPQGQYSAQRAQTPRYPWHRIKLPDQNVHQSKTKASQNIRNSKTKIEQNTKKNVFGRALDPQRFHPTASQLPDVTVSVCNCSKFYQLTSHDCNDLSRVCNIIEYCLPSHVQCHWLWLLCSQTAFLENSSDWMEIYNVWSLNS